MGNIFYTLVKISLMAYTSFENISVMKYCHIGNFFNSSFNKGKFGDFSESSQFFYQFFLTLVQRAGEVFVFKKT